MTAYSKNSKPTSNLNGNMFQRKKSTYLLFTLLVSTFYSLMPNNVNYMYKLILAVQPIFPTKKDKNTTARFGRLYHINDKNMVY